mgnify:CR=1 FL=1
MKPREKSYRRSSTFGDVYMDATMFFMFFSRQLNFFASRNILLDLLDDEAYDTEVNSCN